MKGLPMPGDYQANGMSGGVTKWDEQSGSLSADGSVVAFWSNELPGIFIHEFPSIR